MYAQMRDITLYPISLHANVDCKSEIVFQTNVHFFKILSYKTGLCCFLGLYFRECLILVQPACGLDFLGEAMCLEVAGTEKGV